MAVMRLGQPSTKRRPGAPVSPAKARQILEDGEVRGRPLTARQKRFFGLIAGGGVPRRRQQGK